MTTGSVPYIPAVEVEERETYLNVSGKLRSWLLTRDHKPTALLSLLFIRSFFSMGGAAATLMRLELMTPARDLVRREMYNRFFTIHGVVMVWLFLIPAVPTTIGNFVIPLMIGARDLAFP